MGGAFIWDQRLIALKSSTVNEIRQIDLQIEELVNKRKSLEAKRAKLEAKEQQLRAISRCMPRVKDKALITDDFKSC